MQPGVIVLKFGGSVLTDEERLRMAVHEIYRWRREGWRIVAVVSAFAGRTDELFVGATRERIAADPHAVAAMLSCGERESAARLSISLDRVGLPAVVLDPAAIKLSATGPELDATPTGFDASVLRDVLDTQGVVVVPGFIALDAVGRIVTLGRGGSDLSALVLAQGLNADRCRLIKDVDGLYEHDPASDGPPPDRYECVSYDDALKLDGSIVQHKAIRFARLHELEFEVGSLNATAPTRVGRVVSRTTGTRTLQSPRRVAILGLGTVGGGVVELLAQIPGRFQIAGTAARDPASHASLCRRLGMALPKRDASAVACCGADIVIEAIGGVEAARDAIAAALRDGAHVVTANKAVLARHGRELFAVAETCQRRLLASASAGGGMPVLEAVKRREAIQVRAVLNGTANYVLHRVSEGASVDAAVLEAQRLGLAEADPARDLDGRDSLDKLHVLASHCGIVPIRVEREHADVRSSTPGQLRRQVATLDRHGTLRVTLEHPDGDDPLAKLPDEWNAAEITGADGMTTFLRGRGAGRWPTAEAVLADVFELERQGQTDQVLPRSVALA